MRQAPVVLAIALALAGPAALAAKSEGASAQGPVYEVEPCCNLCPNAANRAAYTTRLEQSATILIQGKDGWLFRTDDDLRSTFGPDDTGYAEMKRFRDALKAKGVELVMVYQPARGLMHPDKLPASAKSIYNPQLARFSYGATLQRFRNLGITVPHMEDLVNQRGGDDAYFFKGDHHWTPRGSQRTAHVVAEAIKAMPVYATLPKGKFVTERTGIWSKRGTLQKAATQLCGFGYPDTYVPRYVTASADAGDPLGDSSVPQVTLVGTSNSDAAYNFAGFLSEELGVDILNEAVTGGGHEGALMQYLPSQAFQKTPPKILIWELETYHNLSKTLFYRQVVPLVSDGCHGKPVKLSRKVALKKEKTEAVFNGGGGSVQDIRNKDNLLDITFSDPNVRQLKGIAWFTNGSKETISIEHSDYIETGGRFVVELRSDPDWGDRGFMSLDILTPEGVAPGTTVETQVCGKAEVASNDAPKPDNRKSPFKNGRHP